MWCGFGGQINEQVKTSRDEAVDDYAKRGEWPPGEIDHDCKGEKYATNAVEFIEHNVGPSPLPRPNAGASFTLSGAMPSWPPTTTGNATDSRGVSLGFV